MMSDAKRNNEASDAQKFDAVVRKILAIRQATWHTCMYINTLSNYAIYSCVKWSDFPAPAWFPSGDPR
jgi:hypothetical protein